MGRSQPTNSIMDASEDPLLEGPGPARSSVRRSRPLARVLILFKVGVLSLVVWVILAKSRLQREYTSILAERSEEARVSGGVPPVALLSGDSGGDAAGALRPGDQPATARLRVLTYNVWALPVPMPPSAKRRRLPRIPDRVAALDPDIVAFQEAFRPAFRDFAVRFFGDRYDAGEQHACVERFGLFVRRSCTGGLLTLSGFPVVRERFVQHAPEGAPKLDERYSGKGFMITTVETLVGPLHVVNMHLHAGRTLADDEWRVGQLREFARVAEESISFEAPVVLLGDLNVVHPSLVAEDGLHDPSLAYAFLTDSLGFVETVADARETGLTYDAEENEFAGSWLNGGEGRQKLDYVLYRVPAGFTLEVTGVRVVLDGPDPLSDHYGLLAEIELTRGGPGGPRGPGGPDGPDGP